MRIVADSHAIVWYLQGSSRLSSSAYAALREAETTDGIVVSVATLVDLWYVAQTTKGVTAADLTRFRDRLVGSSSVELRPIDAVIADGYTQIPQDVLADSWDRFIVATARTLAIPLVTRDAPIQQAQLVQFIW